MSGRENILRRVKAAVAVKSPRLFEKDAPAQKQSWYEPIGDGFEALRDRFSQELTALKGEFIDSSDASEAHAKLRELVARNGFERVVAQDTPVLRKVVGDIAVKWLPTDTAGGHALKGFDLSITTCESLAARTGSVVVSARGAGGRAMSVLPTNHLVIATRDQLLPDLADALKAVREKYGEKFPSYVGVITGPSRTSDIEKVLVMGAHGPKRLFVMVLGH